MAKMCSPTDTHRFILRYYQNNKSNAFHGIYVITHHTLWYSLDRWSIVSDCFITTTKTTPEFVFNQAETTECVLVQARFRPWDCLWTRGSRRTFANTDFTGRFRVVFFVCVIVLYILDTMLLCHLKETAVTVYRKRVRISTTWSWSNFLVDPGTTSQSTNQN